ncbi:MAG: orotidine-5'-phosphate decarboxylase [Candidatus Omnitrophica bacterium]|nr:orotidine-5'-phosphate decarboxylase [Candidatus Omnitrophota bacterium]
MSKEKPKLIVALDVRTFEEARNLIETLSPVVDIFKVGSQLFTSCGPVSVRYIQAKGKEVFLDLKYHDIPNTVANAVEAASYLQPSGSPEFNNSNKSILMYTLHTVGGKEMLQKAAQMAQKTAQNLGFRKPLSLGITVLTSEENGDNIQNLVVQRALLAKEAGLDGVVASVHEAALIRQKLGEDFVIVTPGIRPKDSDVGDQKRVATPSLAVSAGSNYLVVGRPIVQSKDPLESAQKILEEIQNASK